MKRVQLRSINDSRLPSHKHLLAVLEVVDDDGSRVAQSDLKHRMLVLAPPFLADCGVVFAELEEMAHDWSGMRDFVDAFDLGDVCLSR